MGKAAAVRDVDPVGLGALGCLVEIGDAVDDVVDAFAVLLEEPGETFADRADVRRWRDELETTFERDENAESELRSTRVFELRAQHVGEKFRGAVDVLRTKAVDDVTHS